MKLFREKSINHYFNDLHTVIKRDIENMEEDNFMRQDPLELVTSIVTPLNLNHLKIDLKNKISNTEIIEVLGENHPSERHFDVSNGVKYPRARVNYIYDLPKQADLLAYEPTGFRHNSQIEASIVDDKLYIHYQTWNENENLPQDIKNKVKNDMSIFHDDINHSVSYINIDIDKFNNGLKEFITQLVVARRNEINKRNNQNDELNDF